MDNAITTLSSTGMFVWWNLDDSRVTPADLRTILTDEGFTPATEVPDIEPSAGIKRATQEWSQGRGHARRYKCEVTRDVNGVTTVGLLTRETIDEKTVEWVQVGLAEYDSNVGSWTVATNDAEHDEALAAFKDLASARMAYLDHRWIRPNILTHTMSGVHSVNLRKGSGFYFVPRQHLDEMKRLRRVIRRIGNSDLSIAVVGNDQDTVESVSGAAKQHILTTIAEVDKRLADWRDGERAVRSDSQAHVLQELADLISLAETYEAALDVKLEALRSNIGACRRRALQIIADKN